MLNKAFVCALVLLVAPGLAYAQEPPAPESCIAAGQQVLGACQAALAELAPIYPLASTVPATDKQAQDGVVAMKIGQQPTQTCCDAIKAFAGASCDADPSLLETVLPATGVQAEGLKSTLSIMQTACGP